MKKFLSLALSALFSISLLASCGAKSAAVSSTTSPETSTPVSGADGPTIVTTIFPYYDFSRAVVGDTSNITMLLKPGAEPHSFDPSPSDIIAVEDADVFIYTGGVDDAWADKILSSVDTSKMTVIRALDIVTPLEEETVEGMEEEHDHDHAEETEEHTDSVETDHEEETHDHDVELDEHVWTSPKNAVLLVNAIADALEQKDRKNADLYKANAAAYTTEIDALDTQFTDIVNSSERKFMVFGGRFPFLYFAKEYGLTYRAAFPGCSTDTNPSSATVAYLIDTVSENNLPYIFDIELSNGAIASTIAKETGAEVLTMNSCEIITADEFKNGETYVTLMQRNAENLEKGLN